MLDCFVLNLAMECDFKKEVRADIPRVCSAKAHREHLEPDLDYERMFRLLLEEVQRERPKLPTKIR
jgi:hypothetical protein